MREKQLMLAMRSMYAAAILLFAILGNWNVVLFQSLIFFGSLFVPFLGKKDPDYWTLDTLITLTFFLSLFPTYYSLWQNPQGLIEAILGYDKLFHMAGGACLAMFAAIILRKRVTDKIVFYIGIVVFALALGATWELFEWGISLLPPPIGVPTSGYMDSMLDLVADTLGAAILAGVLMLRRYF